MSDHYHAVVWIDHHQARVLGFNESDADCEQVQPQHPTRHIHHKANSIGSGHSAEDQNYFEAVVQAIGAAGAVLITGPANAKHELLKHIERCDPAMRSRVAAVQTLDHPSDGELVAHARKFFHAADRMASQSSQR
jgi:hypothetical protein